jgi:DNA-directed RNA polymerase specialized sigma24 family protein
MQTTLNAQHTADLHWLAFLLTGRRDQSIDLAVETVADFHTAQPFFTAWMEAWSRRVVIAKALTGIREELAASARRTEFRRFHGGPPLPPHDWRISQGTTKSELEEALLAIDHFPRAALVLSIFEGVPAPDCAVILDASPDLVKKALTIGLLELTRNLASAQGSRSQAACPFLLPPETQYA